MFDNILLDEARALVSLYTRRGMKLVTAESCTGGLLSAVVTEIPGSSAMFERGFVTYANESKTAYLGISPALIHQHGAVSSEVANAMAIGALTHSPADVSLAITGIAGPTGGSPEKPVGLVFIGSAARARQSVVEKHQFRGDRTEIRRRAVLAGLALLKTMV